ncbi:MAG: hypothetical protein JWR18_1675 [Segetibacter sp.]|jgi:hypothetical protein|nr:hypothetical protein [Segetibacter sp.]
MIIALKWVKKVKSKTRLKLNKFFLAFFNLCDKPDDNTSSIPKTLRENRLDFHRREIELLKYNFCNLPALRTIPNPVSSSIERISKQLEKMVFIEKKMKVSSASNTLELLIEAFLTFSVSFFKQTYPQNWKTIFVHLFEKSNLLVRSDNNTGFFSPKILQTTTI